MCRLFGLHAGTTPVAATFWLIDAPDSLAAQSRRNPDGAGIGVFDGHGRPFVDKQPLAAWEDSDFASAAHSLRSATFIAHVRYASTGGLTSANTHPFAQDGRLFAHNGMIEGLPELDARLTELGVSDLVQGETDSERIFALITAEAATRDGDVTGGIVAAVTWIGDNLPVFAINIVLVTATDLWALRYPDTHELYVLDRPRGSATSPGLDAASSRIRAASAELAARPSVVIATERMDDDPGWRLLGAGELVHVGADLAIESSHPFAAPRHQLSLADLEPAAAASQHPTAGA